LNTRRREAGFTIIEVLIAAAIGTIIMLAFGSFFLSAIRFGQSADTQATVQRFGTLIAEDLGQRLRLADGSPDVEDPASPPATPVCVGAVTTNDLILVIPNTSGSTTCMYRTTDASPLLARCDIPSGGGACSPIANMLSGTLVPLTAACAPGYSCTPWSVATVTPCVSAGGTCTGSVCSISAQSCTAVPGATVEFTISDGTSLQETFGVTVVTSRH
jgi:prepilin-type N-terminal cleavage/methylation domain-containing protein